jgi:hypothetical protein
MTPFKINSQIRYYLVRTAKILTEDRKVKGWRRIQSTSRHMDVFFNDGLGVVLKHPKFILEHRTPSFLRIPTVKLGDGWVVQPKARRTDLKAAVDQIRTHLEPYLAKGIFPDIHHGNVGWYNGKPLMFDW